MRIPNAYLCGRLIKRYKRFLADILLDSGEIITVHTPNTGAMLGCAEPGSRVWVYKAENPKRKYAYSWELVEDAQANLIGIHTGRVNALVSEAIANGVVAELADYEHIRQEVKFLQSSTRFDLLLSSDTAIPDCFVEIKNVTAKIGDTAIFPDAVTERGYKHLNVLKQARELGFRAVMFYCIQREDISAFSPAYAIDEKYAAALEMVKDNGVEVMAYKAKVSVNDIQLIHSVPVVYRNK